MLPDVAAIEHCRLEIPADGNVKTYFQYTPGDLETLFSSYLTNGDKFTLAEKNCGHCKDSKQTQGKYD